MSSSSSRPPSGAPPGAATPLAGTGVLCSCDQQVEPGPAGEIVLLRVTGEIDIATLAVVEKSLRSALDRRPADLVVDLAGVGFCCVRGFAVLSAAARTADAGPTRFAVSGLSRRLDRIASLLWAGENHVRYRSAAAAVSSIRVDHSYRPT